MDDDLFYRALLGRDHRFDGRFFVGVKTTGIYCRPICQAKPKRENVVFFRTARAAEREGFRPCSRCRPESAPDSPAWVGTSAVVRRALKVIATEIGRPPQKEDEFAARFGITARHLRRLFDAEVGLTPQQLYQIQRLGFARQLVVETDLAIAAIAFATGFASLRRFNAAFKACFKKAPRELRRAPERQPASSIELSLAYRPPLDFATLLSFHRAHLVRGLESVSDTSFERLFKIDGALGLVRVANDEARGRLRVRVSGVPIGALPAVTERVRQIFDLDSDPLLVANAFRAHPALNALAARYPGLRVARGWDPFETAVATILGQLVSVTQARSLLGELLLNYGEAVTHPGSGETVHLFPSPSTLAGCDLLRVRTTAKRRAAIQTFARAVASGQLELSATADPAIFHERFLGLAGIGPWTAEYVSLRGLGDTDAFPATDLILKRALERHPTLDLERVRPWRAYAAIYLWKHYAATLSKRKTNSL